MKFYGIHGPTVLDSNISYQDIYESVPVSIWVEDWSAAKIYTDDLKRRGVADMAAYFIEHPGQLRDLASRVDVYDVNWTSVTLYRAPSKQALIDQTWGATMSDNELSAFREQVAAFSSGRTAIATEGQEVRFDGKRLWVRNRVLIHPHYLEDWSLVLFAVTDISDTMVAGKVLGGNLERLSDILSNVPCALYRRVLKPDGTVTYPYISGLGRLLPDFGPEIDDGGLISEAVLSGASNHPDDGVRWDAAWRDSAEQCATIDIEFRVVDPTGRTSWIRNTATPHRGDSGDITWDGVMIAVAGR